MINLTPGEAATLTGIEPVQQRDWRRRGHLAGDGEGWNVFDAVRLSHLFILAVFAKQGRVADGARVAPKLSAPLAEYLQSVVAGGSVGEPQHAAAIWANGEVGVYADVPAAFEAATVEQQDGAVVLIALSVISTPWAIKVRDHVLAKEGGV